MSIRDIERLLRPSVISGLVRLRTRLRDQSDLTVETACKMLRATYDGAGMDYEGARVLHDLVPLDIVERHTLYRYVIRLVAKQASPTWCTLLRLGRDALSAADADVMTCFQRAGAFDAVPSAEVVQWWDELASASFADLDVSRMAIGREAERLSLMYERQLLAEQPGAPEVIWKSLDSNAAGYDLQSWQLFEGRWLPKYIEVKGSERRPPRLHMTRHEWNSAVRHGAAYTFQVWDLARRSMVEVLVEQMALHIPTDNGQGAWEEAVIQLSDGVGMVATNR